MFPARIGDWDNLIILCAGVNFDYNVKMSDRSITEELCKISPVLYVDPPVSCLTPVKNPQMTRQLLGPRLRLQAPNIARLTPIVEPFPSRGVLVETTSALLRGYIRRAVARLGTRHVTAILSGLPQYSIFDACEHDVSVYWAHDDYVGGASLLGFNPSLLDRHEKLVAARADLVIAANPLVAETWRARGSDVALIPFGANVSAYQDLSTAALPADADLPDPVVGFVGHINRRIDISLLEAIANRGRSLLLIGPKDPAFEPARFAALTDRPNVRWVGHKKFSELPGYYRRIAVGLVPYGESAFNRGSFPLKTIEYLAAGIPVVSTDLPATRWLATDLVSIANEPGPFADHADRLIPSAGDPLLMARRKAFAARHDWSIRATEFHEAIAARQRRRARIA